MKRSSESTIVRRRSSAVASSLVSGLRKAPVSIFSRSQVRWRCEEKFSI
jgi:hypothetical protein